MTLADRMAVFMEGEIQQVGRPIDVFAKPNSVEVAAFIGSPPMNLVPARYVNGMVRIGDRDFQTSHSEAGERDVVVGIRPSALRLSSAGASARVELIEHLGDAAVIDLDVQGQRMRARVGDQDIPGEGDQVFISARAEDIHLFDAVTRKRL